MARAIPIGLALSMAWSLEAMATTGDAPFAKTRGAPTFTTFGPYVPAVDERGRVVFTAHSAGASGVFVADGDGVTSLLHADADDRGFDVVSHPVAFGQRVAAYVARAAAAATRPTALAIAGTFGAGASLVSAGVGPLGPTINAHGDVAFRATDAADIATILRLTARGQLTCIARADGAPFRAFHGLPVIDDLGRIVFRADGATGAGIYVGDGTTVREVGDGSAFAALGFFPALAAAGVVAIAGRTARGESRALVTTLAAADARWETAFVPDGDLTGVRGALVDETGGLVVIATRADASPVVVDVDRDTGRGRRIVAVGDACFGSRVRELALNPVSVRGAGVVAVRLVLDDGREVIARATRR